MVERLSDRLREFLKTCQGRDVDLKYLRAELKIDPMSPAWNGLRQYMGQFAQEKIVRASGKNDGTYHVIKQVQAISVFGKERRPPIEIAFPRDLDSGYELNFADDVIIREGDLILIAGLSNFGKTTLALNFAAENIHLHPVLMGNEYTSIDNQPSSRFLSRLDAMDWVTWATETGDNFTLLPVHSDYAEHIVKDKINIIDWINIESGEHFLIGTVMEGIKRELGKGIGIIVIQKAEGAMAGRGAQFTKDFADLEILLDRFPESPNDEVLLTLGKVKEAKSRLTGRTYAYGISKGVKIFNFREVVKCKGCFGKGWKMGKPCDECNKSGFVNKL